MSSPTWRSTRIHSLTVFFRRELLRRSFGDRIPFLRGNASMRPPSTVSLPPNLCLLTPDTRFLTPFGFVEIGLDHHGDEVFEGHLRRPSEATAGLGRVGLEHVNLRGPVEGGINHHVLAPIEPDMVERDLNEFLDAMANSGADDVVIGLTLLQHEPHGPDVVTGVAPIAA